jgi:hypothetical protein
VKRLWDPEQWDIDGNEKADELARQGSGSKFCGPELNTKDFWMPAVQTVDCSASMDCDQILTELVKKQA